MDARELELLAAAAICDAGISLPLEVAFRRRPVRVTMRIPVTWSLVRVSRLYLKMGVTRRSMTATRPTNVSASSPGTGGTSAASWRPASCAARCWDGC